MLWMSKAMMYVAATDRGAVMALFVIDFVLVAVTAVIIGMMAVMTVILTQLSSRLL